MTHLTVTEAAARVKRNRSTIERWIAAGLTVVHVNGKRYIDEEQLLKALRDNLIANPSRARRADERG